MKHTPLLVGLVALIIITGVVLSPIEKVEARLTVIWPQVSLVEIASGFNRPVQITHAGDGSGRLFVVEQAGLIKILNNGVIQGIFLDISDRVRSPSSGGGNEEGPLSVVFPPGFGSHKDYFYVYYT